MMTAIHRPYLHQFMTFYYEYLPRIKEVEHKRWLELGGEEEEEVEETVE